MQTYSIHRKPVKPLKITLGEIYSDWGWDLYNGKSHWGKWVSHPVRFRWNGNPHHFAWPRIHLWRSYQLCKDCGYKMNGGRKRAYAN